MEVGLILKVAGIGIIVSVACQILGKSGRDEQSTYVIIAGILAVFVMLIGEMRELFDLIEKAFGL